MEHPTYLDQVAEQAAQLPRSGIRRIVVPVGSGMTLAAIVHGLHASGHPAPVLGVRVGGDPTRTLDRHAPGWQHRAQLTASGQDFHARAHNHLGTLALDPHYEERRCPISSRATRSGPSASAPPRCQMAVRDVMFR